MRSLPSASAEPNKLGKVPKNARLMQAMAQHKSAKPKPKGWLMGISDQIFKDGETLMRKFSRAGKH